LNQLYFSIEDDVKPVYSGEEVTSIGEKKKKKKKRFFFF
jgi:hypothetical protein